MSKQRIGATLAVGLLLLISMVGLRHIDRLNDGIKLKEIELQDNSLRLELLDKKYIELNKELDKTGADKKKLEQDLQQLQEERLRLQEALQAKKQQKANDLAVKTQRAVTGTAVASASGNFYKDFIYQHESGGILTRTNSIGCYGLGQSCGPALANACPNWQTDYACQDNYWESYAASYGGWEASYNFWNCIGSCYSARIDKVTVKTATWW